MRGTPRAADRMPFDIGIIPAYAGNTRLDPGCMPLYGDHPRVCGEHRQRELRQRRPTGSSPRMRGTPPLFRGQQRWRGIIPAYAGNTARNVESAQA